MSTVRIELPQHLRALAGADREIALEVAGIVSVRSVLDALEARYPVLQGTIRDHDTQKRRAFLRFFACGEDWSHEPADQPLPDTVAAGREPLLVIGAIAGGCWPHGRTASHPNAQRSCVGDSGPRGRFRRSRSRA